MKNINKDTSVTPLMYTLNKPLNEIIYPEAEYYQQGYLQVSKLHSLWYAQYGNPEGVPVITIHGGPGFGCAQEMRFFDLKFYRVILLDQRGAKRSKPFGELTENTTQDLIADLEKLREHLKIDKWLIFGGSWGTTLSIAYGEAHPAKCLGFILRAVFLARKSDFEHIWYGMKDHFPETWNEFVNFLPLDEQNDLVVAYDKRLNDSDLNMQLAAARSFMKYDLTCAFAFQNKSFEKILQDDDMVLNVSKIFVHYCKNNFYLELNQLLENCHQIKHLPSIIINGRFDVITRPFNAFELHQNWPGSKLVIVQDAGHSSLEPGIANALVEATEQMKKSIK